MKKLLLLFLAVAGMVSTASAQRTDPDKVKIYVNAKNVSGGDFWNDVVLHYWDNGSNGIKATDADKTTLTFDNMTWYVFTLDATLAGKITFAIHDTHETESWSGSHRTADYTAAIYNDTFFYINWNGSGNYCKLDIEQNYMYVYRINDKKSFLMTPGVNSTYSINIDNQTSPSSAFRFVFATSKAFKNDGSYEINWDNDEAKWHFWRPAQTSSDKVLTFVKETNIGTWNHSGELNAFDISGKPSFYNITVDRSDYNNFTFSVDPYFTRTIGEAGYLTWSNDEKYTVEAGEGEGATVTAYTVTDKNTYAKLNEQAAGTVFPASTGLVLGGSGEVIIKAVASDATAATITDNDLVGSGNSGTSISAGSYVLYWDGTNASSVGFTKTAAGTLGAHKAYLASTGSDTRSFLGFNEDVDGINEVGFNIDNGDIFNLQGIRLNKMQKGLNVINGKKVMVK